MRSALQLLGGVAAAGAVAAGATAFTASGVTTSSTAALPQFIGGTVTQAVTGAELSNIAYAFSDATNTIISSVTLTFLSGSANGKAVTLTPVGGGITGTAATWTCAAGANTTLCTVKDSGPIPVTGAANGWLGLTSLGITVA
jgi:hypothetical protein